MQPLSQLSASTLRNLLLRESRHFIDELDKSTLEELQSMQQHMKALNELLKEKELKELEPINWGKNTTIVNQQTTDPLQKKGLISVKIDRTMPSATAILAGGCFWGVEELIRQLPGVTNTTVGYTGGDVPNATYRNHGTHAEGIKIEFDPERLTYRRLLEFFFQIHDPTTLNRQGNDRGTSYRSAIFYLNEDQKATALNLIRELNASRIWPSPIVTEVVAASDFWDAEKEHQDYLQKNPHGYTCHYVRPDWKVSTPDQSTTA